MGNIAIIGYGTVGKGVAEVLRGGELTQRAGRKPALKYILDVRQLDDSCYVNDFSVILNDPEVEVVAETIGGASHAYEFTRAALAAGKSVVTSNKELVAMHGDKLLAAARENNVSYLFEGAVGGGIPLIRPLGQCLAANRIDEVYGILNGTTNYILTNMTENGMDFETALKQAQKLGYAEHDPGDDIEGRDVCRKVCILASLAFGYHVNPGDVPTQGITQVRPEDIIWAKSKGYAVKLIGRAARLSDSITAYVAPHMVPMGNMLARVSDVYNAVSICGDAVGDVMFYGRGAGSLPTASAVVADIIDALSRKGTSFGWQPAKPGWVVSPEELKEQWYVPGAGLCDSKPKSGFAMRVLG